MENQLAEARAAKVGKAAGFVRLPAQCLWPKEVALNLSRLALARTRPIHQESHRPSSSEPEEAPPAFNAAALRLLVAVG